MSEPPGGGGNGARFNEALEASAAYAELKTAVRGFDRQLAQTRAEMAREIKEIRQQVQAATAAQTKTLQGQLDRIELQVESHNANPMLMFGRFLQSGKGFLLTLCTAIASVGGAAWGITTLVSLVHQYGIGGWHGH